MIFVTPRLPLIVLLTTVAHTLRPVDISECLGPVRPAAQPVIAHSDPHKTPGFARSWWDWSSGAKQAGKSTVNATPQQRGGQSHPPANRTSEPPLVSWLGSMTKMVNKMVRDVPAAMSTERSMERQDRGWVSRKLVVKEHGSKRGGLQDSVAKTGLRNKNARDNAMQGGWSTHREMANQKSDQKREHAVATPGGVRGSTSTLRKGALHEAEQEALDRYRRGITTHKPLGLEKNQVDDMQHAFEQVEPKEASQLAAQQEVAHNEIVAEAEAKDQAEAESAAELEGGPGSGGMGLPSTGKWQPLMSNDDNEAPSWTTFYLQKFQFLIYGVVAGSICCLWVVSCCPC